jgi:hypothetical protein
MMQRNSAANASVSKIYLAGYKHAQISRSRPDLHLIEEGPDSTRLNEEIHHSHASPDCEYPWIRQHQISNDETGETYAHETLGLIAASLRMINQRTLEIPIKGANRLCAVVTSKPAATRMYVPTNAIWTPAPGSGAPRLAVGYW